MEMTDDQAEDAILEQLQDAEWSDDEDYDL